MTDGQDRFDASTQGFDGLRRFVAQPETGPHWTVEPLDEMVRQQILRALKEAGGNKSRAARMLKIDRSTLYSKLRHYGIGL